MIIRKAQSEDREMLQRYFKEAFPNRSGESLEALFAIYYDIDTLYLYTNESEVVSVTHVKDRILRLNDKNLKVSYIASTFTRPQFQGKGYLSTFLTELLEVLGTKSLVTLLKAYEPSTYDKLGFERVIDVATYRINALDIADYGVQGILMQPKAKDLLKAYNTFTKHFDGYFQRDEAYYEALKKDYARRGGDIVGLVVGDKLVGYCIYDINGNHVEVKECVYDKAGTMMRLLSHVSKGKNSLMLWASEAENISKIYPNAKRSVQPYLSARLNDKELFERLYDIRIISAYSALNAFDKPIFNREFD